jgi:hypothetical protein
MKKLSTKRLSLNVDTIRSLTDHALRGAAGGATTACGATTTCLQPKPGSVFTEETFFLK